MDGGPTYEWSVHYFEGQAACSRGKWEECRGAMALALAGRAESGLQLRSGPDLVDYTPHYFIALANYNLQDESAAAVALEKEAGYGVIQKTAYAGAFQTRVKAILNPPSITCSTPTKHCRKMSAFCRRKPTAWR